MGDCTSKSNPRSPASRDILVDEDLRAFARYEGRPFPSARDVAKELAIPLSRAFKLLARIKERGVAREVAVLSLRPDCCHSVTYLRARLERPGVLAALEQRLATDRAIQTVSRITGAWDYRVAALHSDARAANDWFREVLADPVVANGRQQFVRILFRRSATLGAVLDEPQEGAITF